MGSAFEFELALKLNRNKFEMFQKCYKVYQLLGLNWRYKSLFYKLMWYLVVSVLLYIHLIQIYINLVNQAISISKQVNFMALVSSSILHNIYVTKLFLYYTIIFICVCIYEFAALI